MPLTGVLFFFAIFTLGVIWSAGRMIFFFDVPSLIIVFGIVAASLLAGGRCGDFFRGVKAWMSGGASPAEADLANGAAAFDLAFRASIGAAAIGLVLGAVLVFCSLHEMPKVGPYLAISVISSLYGLALAYQVFLPARMAIEKKIMERKGASA